MAAMYCALCRRPVEARRHVGAVTIVLGVLTWGLAFIAVPFFPKRCSICRGTALSPVAPDGGPIELPGPSAARVAHLEQRLGLTEADLDAAHAELHRLREERDFYRQLLGDPTRRARDRPDREG